MKDRHVKDRELNLYRRKDFSGIVYSDGDEAELGILESVKKAADRSTFSTELARAITDWPSEYHLGRQRHCIVRPLGIQPGERVLELGSGCGAITRYLGELGASVTSVEGSLRRAQIAAERCRDLPNVRIIAEDLLRFQSDEEFDWILLIGVLEYAPTFSDESEPALSYLRRGAGFLAPCGRLVVAIENKLGLKYFNGCGEDHLGIPFYGVQGLYSRNQTRTFGKRELEEILKAVGLDSIAFWYPFPDYKLPRVVLSGAGLADPAFDPAELLATVYARDYGGTEYRLFDEPLAFREAARNGLLGEFSNSFLVVAQRDRSEISQERVLGVTYAVKRLPQFAAETRLVRDGEVIRVRKQLLFPGLSHEQAFEGTTLRHVPKDSDYLFGRLTLWRLIEARARRGSLDEIIAALLPWFEYLLASASKGMPNGGQRWLSDFTLDGHFADLTPFNVIEANEGLRAIDMEWQIERRIPLGWVVTRSIFICLSYPGFEADDLPVMDVIRGLCSRHDLDVFKSDIVEWLKIEGSWHTAITGENFASPSLMAGSKRLPGLVAFNVGQRNDALNYVLTRYRKLSRSAAEFRFPRFRLRSARAPAGALAEQLEVIRHSAFFDAEFYLEANPDVAAVGMDPALHYVLQGTSERRDPGPCFSTKRYLAENPDVMSGGVNALVHYECHGCGEGRNFPIVSASTLERRSRSTGRPSLWKRGVAHCAQLMRKLFEFSVDAKEPEIGSKDVESSIEYVPLFKGNPLGQKLAKLICFYLPQFHAIPENDDWWGEGFTEWTNVQAAKPKFQGHYQPRIPGELGYYDLSNPEVQRRQIELAKLYGIEGFCFYFYWFGGKRLLEKPVENYLNDRSLDLPFCLCWANENWTRRWDGLDEEILISQHHSLQDDLAFIQCAGRYFLDPRYIRVDGRPLLIVYRPGLLPSANETVGRWRNWCRSNGVGEIYLAYTQSFDRVDPTEYGFDAAIEFPPNAIPPTDISRKFLPKTGSDNSSVIYDWMELLKLSESYERTKYTLFRGVCPAWDNTARRKNRSTTYVNNTPARYRLWLQNAVRDTRRRFVNPDERLLFVNAWNEWGEGAYLEPDARYGYAYLQATRDAIRDAETQDDPPVLLVIHDCHPNGAQLLTLEIARQLKFDGFGISIVALEGGELQDEFTSIGSMINAKEAGDTALEHFLGRLRMRGARHAITSTVVSGSIVPQLKKLGFRVLSLIHELPGVIRDRGQEQNAETIARFADKVVFPAEVVREKFEEIAAVDVERVVIRHQGVLRKNPYRSRKAEAYRVVCERHRLRKGTKIVLNVAYGDLRKGPDLFLEVAAKVLSERSDTTFIWVGGRPSEIEPKIALTVQELGLQNKVFFVDFDREPLAYYAAASVYALTSREDPFPNVVLESTEAEVPVVAFEGATGATNFIIERGGRVATYPDTGDFARHVRELLDTPPKMLGDAPSLRQYTQDLLHHLENFPRISVIVPNYNYGRYLRRRLDSIFHQTFPLYEVLVLDDASTDESVEITRTYFQETKNEGQLLTNECNSGSVFRQWLKGIACCTGDLVWIAEADDLADASFLRELVPAFESPDVVLAFSQSKQIDQDGKVLAENYLEYTKDISDRWRASYVNDGGNEISENLTIKNTIPNVSAVLFRREALAKALDEVGDDLFEYKVAGDWLVYLYVLLQGKVYYKHKSLNLHRRHTNSVTKALDVRNHLQEVCRLQEIAQSLATSSPESLEKARSYIGFLKDHFALFRESQQ